MFGVNFEGAWELIKLGVPSGGASKELPDNLGPHDDEPKSRRSVDTNPKMRANLG